MRGEGLGCETKKVVEGFWGVDGVESAWRVDVWMSSRVRGDES